MRFQNFGHFLARKVGIEGMSREKIHGYGDETLRNSLLFGRFSWKISQPKISWDCFLGSWMGWIEIFGGMDFIEGGTSFLLGYFVRNILFFRIFRRRNLLIGKMVVPLGWRAPSCLTARKSSLKGDWGPINTHYILYGVNY